MEAMQGSTMVIFLVQVELVMATPWRVEAVATTVCSAAKVPGPSVFAMVYVFVAASLVKMD